VLFQLAAQVGCDPQFGSQRRFISQVTRRWSGQPMATGFWLISSIPDDLIASLIDSKLCGCIVLLVLEFKN